MSYKQLKHRQNICNVIYTFNNKHKLTCRSSKTNIHEEKFGKRIESKYAVAADHSYKCLAVMLAKSSQ
jgi:hypothetical protein